MVAVEVDVKADAAPTGERAAEAFRGRVVRADRWPGLGLVVAVPVRLAGLRAATPGLALVVAYLPGPEVRQGHGLPGTEAPARPVALGILTGGSESTRDQIWHRGGIAGLSLHDSTGGVGFCMRPCAVVPWLASSRWWDLDAPS